MTNEKLIADFLTSISAEGLSRNRIRKYKVTLGVIARLLNKDFKKVTKEDLFEFFDQINAGKFRSNKGKEYAEETKRDFKIVVKRFWRWLKPSDDIKAYPKEVSWISTTENDRLKKIIKTKDVLSEDEVYQMVDAAFYQRDKAFISLLFESASRIGEVIDLKISDIVFDDKGYSFETGMGKTGEHYKRIMNIKAVNHLKAWINEHPTKQDLNSPLWVTMTRANLGIRKLGASGISNMLVDTAKKVGITKRVSCHQFRHAKITDLRVNKKVSDAIIEMFVGWKPGSDMFETYQHARSEDIDKAFGQVYTDMDDEKAKKKSNETATQLIMLLVNEIQKHPGKYEDLEKKMNNIMKVGNQ